MRIAAWLHRYRRDILLTGLVFVAAGVPRTADVGTFLTADEKNWIGRGHEFIRAFADGRYNDMLQTTHPGVTTLWLAGAAVTVKTWLDGLSFSFEVLSHFVRLPQFALAATNTLLIALTYPLMVRLLGRRRLALFASLLMAFNPLLVGYGRVVHVDALLTHLMFIAALLILIYAQTGFSRRWLYAAAAAAALALLTKAPAVFLLPWFGLAVLLYERRRLASWPVLRSRLGDAARWLAVILVLGVVLWPALLFVPNPKGNALLIKRDIGQAASQPHDGNEAYTINPQFYAGTLLTRTTPWVQAGVLAAVVLAAMRRRGRTAWLTGWLAAYVFFFVLMMMLGAKKGDRYILPVFPALDVLAAIGFWGVLQLVWQKRKARSVKRKTIVAVFGSLVILMSFASTVYRYHPYAIAYTNPFFPENMSQERGWGEGLEQVAAWLNEHDPQAIVASWYPEELGAFTTARVAHINAHEQHQVEYIVLYHNMFGRPPDHPANDFLDEYYDKREPVFVARVVGKPFVWVYVKPTFRHVVGELTSGVVVSQPVVPRELPLAGIDLVAATYSGKAQQGELFVELREATGATLGEWRVPVAEIKDNTWLSLPLDPPRLVAEAVVEVTAVGTSAGAAPTVRYGREDNWRPGDFSVNGERKKGDLAIRLRYAVDGKEATEEHTKLLSGGAAR